MSAVFAESPKNIGMNAAAEHLKHENERGEKTCSENITYGEISMICSRFSKMSKQAVRYWKHNNKCLNTSICDQALVDWLQMFRRTDGAS